MIDWGAVIIGFVLSIVLGAIFGVIIPVWGVFIGILIAGMLVGYMVAISSSLRYFITSSFAETISFKPVFLAYASRAQLLTRA